MSIIDAFRQLTMKKVLELSLVLVLPLFLLSSCLAVRETKRWNFHQQQERGSPRPAVAIMVVRPGFYVPLLPVLWEVRLNKAYKLELDVHTRDVTYDRLDSVGYRLWVHPGQVLAAGTLPVVNGPFNRRTDAPGVFRRPDYLPNLHRTQCATPVRIVLPNLKQALMGSFWLYVTDATHRPQVVHLDSVPLEYGKARFSTIF